MRGAARALVPMVLAASCSTGARPGAPDTRVDLSAVAPRVTMLFPGGRSRALVLSYDDGPVTDRRLVQLMNRYDLRGTFHLNSSKLGSTTHPGISADYLTREEVRALFRGHEVSVHTANHPNLTAIPRADVIREVTEDRRELERLTGAPVRGMAYPFGNFNDSVVATIRALGIAYARTVGDTHGFSIPDDFLVWHPTIHQFGTAYFTADDPERDRREVAGFFQLVDALLATDSLALFVVWGHSWENDGAGDRWAETERFYRMVARPEVWSITFIGLVDYLHAFRALRFAGAGNTVTNPGTTDVFLRVDGRALRVPASSTTNLR